MEQQQNLPPNIEAATEGMLSSVAGARSSALEISKLRIGFWEKLVILNAGTLALSFTGAASLRGHMVGDGGIGYFFAAWKLLIFSILLSVVAQWLESLKASHLEIVILGGSLGIWYARLNRAFISNALSELPDHAVKSAALLQKAKSSATIGTGLDTMAFLLGVAVQVTTAIAFVWLYKFARINFAHF